MASTLRRIIPFRGWGPLKRRARDLFAPLAYPSRALGLEVINALGRRWGTPEEPAPVLSKHFGIALSRCVIHLIPMFSFAWILFENYRTFYIGPGFGLAITYPIDDAIPLALFQVGAKIQELLCIASLSAVVFHSLRNELIGEGCPIGLLGCGIWFSQISSFWSPSFLGPVFLAEKSWGHLRLYALVLIAGGLAATIGPASAVLLIPRSQYIPAGGTGYFLNGTAADFWPAVVHADTEPAVCSQPNATKYAVCPSGGFESIRASQINSNEHAIKPFYEINNNISSWGRSKTWQARTFRIDSPGALIPSINTFFTLSSLGLETLSIQPHAATTVLLKRLMQGWNNAAYATPDGAHAALELDRGESARNYKWVRASNSSSSTASPLVRVKCSALATNLTDEEDQAAFPFLYLLADADFNQWAHGARMANISSLTRTPPSQVRVQWIKLPIDAFGITASGITTSGVLIELPGPSASRTALGCSIAAAWRTGIVSADSSTDDEAWTINVAGPDYQYGDVFNTATQTHFTSDSSPDGPIELGLDWLNLLWPVTNSPAGNGTRALNTFEQLLVDTGTLEIIPDLRENPQQFLSDQGRCEYRMNNPNMTNTELWNDSTCGKGLKTTIIESYIASMVADGLSRYGSHRQFKTGPTLKDWEVRDLPMTPDFQAAILDSRGAIVLPPSSEAVIQQLSVEILGYAYYASTSTDYIATAVIGLYLLVAGAHVVWLLVYRISSSSWDSVTELLALCLNSPPSAALAKTSASIQHVSTYAKEVKVRALSSAPGESGGLIWITFEEPLEVDQEKTISSSSSATQTHISPDVGHTKLAVTSYAVISNSSSAAISRSVQSAAIGGSTLLQSLPRQHLGRVKVNERYE